MANWLQDMESWIQSGGKQAMYDINHNSSGIAGPWNPAGEGGVDLGATIGTPVYALASGPIMAVQHSIAPHPGGVVSQRVSVPGHGTQDIYYQHIDVLPSLGECKWGTCNIFVQKGQQIGTVGSAGETEVGFNAGWGGVWGGCGAPGCGNGNHPGGWATNPQEMIAALMGSSGNYLGNTTGSSSSSSTPTSPTACQPWDIPCLFSEALHTDIFQRISIVTVGIILALVGIIVLFVGEGAKIAKKHPEVLAA